MSALVVSREDIAEIYDALGRPEKAEQVRAVEAMETEDIDASESLDEIQALLNGVPEMPKGKHDDECWKKHAPCLADRIGALLP